MGGPDAVLVVDKSPSGPHTIDREAKRLLEGGQVSCAWGLFGCDRTDFDADRV
jgi:hypothetical protein